MEKGQKRITIGVLAGGILDDFTKVVSRGVLRAAKRLGVNVVVLPGKYLDAEERRKTFFEVLRLEKKHFTWHSRRRIRSYTLQNSIVRKKLRNNKDKKR